MNAVDPSIEVGDLVIRYPGGVTAVDGVSFSARAGEVLALLGPNGAGKTTTIEALEGYRNPTRGTVRVLGLDPRADRRALVPRIGVMLQGGGVYPGIRPGEALRLFAAYYDHPADADELLVRLGLEAVASTPWRRLSGGEQQRLSLALALVGRPEVVFLDEPTAGIDVSGRQLVRRIISELRSAGTCVTMATHELDEAEKVADRVVIVDKGRVLAAGRPADLVATVGAGLESLTFSAADSLDTTRLSTRLGVPVQETTAGRYRAVGVASVAAMAVLTSWLAEENLTASELRAGGATLEDVFLRLTRNHDTGDGDESPS